MTERASPPLDHLGLLLASSLTPVGAPPRYTPASKRLPQGALGGTQDFNPALHSQGGGLWLKTISGHGITNAAKQTVPSFLRI